MSHRSGIEVVESRDRFLREPIPRTQERSTAGWLIVCGMVGLLFAVLVAQAAWAFSPPPDRMTVDLNKDVKNTTGGAANDLHLVYMGKSPPTWHLDGRFGSFKCTQAPGISPPVWECVWSNPTTPIGAGESTHVGLGATLQPNPWGAYGLMAFYWTMNGTEVGNVPQMKVIYSDRVLIFWNNLTGADPNRPLYVGFGEGNRKMRLEWYRSYVDPSRLNRVYDPSDPNKPPRATDPNSYIGTDEIAGPSSPVAAGRNVHVTIPAPPADAQYLVVVNDVSADPNFDPNVTNRDFYQLPAQPVGAVPTLTEWGILLLVGLMAASGLFLLWKRRRHLAT